VEKIAVGFLDKKNVNTTNLTELNQTESRQTDQSGGLLTFSDVAGGVALDLSSRSSFADSHDVYDSRSSSSTSSTSIANSGNTTTTLSDAGAISAGLELGRAGIGAARDAGALAANSYGESLTVLERINADSLELLGGLANNAIDASRTLARDSAEAGSNVLEQALGGLSSLAKQNSQSADDRLTKIVGIALAAIAAVVVLPVLFKSGGKAVMV
jgi:hypothetical protein